jgi:tetratricopeptide (TPR) repeat protein
VKPISLLAAALAGALAAPAHAFRMIDDGHVEEAAREVEAALRARPHDPETAFLDGNLAFLRGDYARAAERMREAIRKQRDPSDDERALAALAEATAAATREFVETRGTHFRVRHAPGKDALLVPYALDALERAYRALAADFGDAPSEPVRVEIYPEVADLAKVSTLTLREIETSGTIALCKFNRIMIVSPRALMAGYPWMDTLAHEYTHFIVTRVSRNTVPIWLHEGLAKLEEARWRDTAPRSDGRPAGLTPTMEHLLAGALGRKRLITFEQMHPSMAKLPSQEDSALAFAEVYMALVYLQQQIGWDGIRHLIGALRDGHSDEEAVATALGRPFAQFQHDWRAWLHEQKLRTRAGLVPTALKFKKAPDDRSSNEDASEIAEDKARKLARLGGLLRARRRLRAAASEYEKAAAIIGPGHPQVANPLGRTYLELGDAERAIATALPTLELYPDQAAPSAMLGEGYLKKGDFARAQQYFEAALRISPFDPAIHCGLERILRRRDDPRAAEEAAACRTLGG